MVFLGLLFERGEERLIASKSRGGFLQNQVNTFQWNCIDGLHDNGIDDLTIINALPVGTYPRMYSDAYIPSKRWNYQGNTHFQVATLNLPVLKQWGRYCECKKLLKKLNDKEILIYSPYQPFLKAIRNLDKSYHITLIVPDLPEYYDYSRVSIIRKILRKINNRSIDKCMSRVDRFVLLTEAMKIPLNVGNRPYTVVEAISSIKKADITRERSLDKKIILYAGSLSKTFGIEVLMNAFTHIKDDNYELWICGGGDYSENIEKAAERDGRIKFFGYVTKDMALSLQAKATVLVNPRQNIGEYTKYSFPSKTIEYLLSGVPVVSYKLDGIPDEYDPYIRYVEDNTPQGLATALREVCEDIEGIYEHISKRAVEFIENQKNPQKQTEKILDLMGYNR